MGVKSQSTIEHLPIKLFCKQVPTGCKKCLFGDGGSTNNKKNAMFGEKLYLELFIWLKSCCQQTHEKVILFSAQQKKSSKSSNNSRNIQRETQSSGVYYARRHAFDHQTPYELLWLRTNLASTLLEKKVIGRTKTLY